MLTDSLQRWTFFAALTASRLVSPAKQMSESEGYIQTAVQNANECERMEVRGRRENESG